MIPDVIKRLSCYTISKDMPNTLLILHVKGTDAETAELPRHIVRAAVSEGKLTRSQLIWSPVDNAWKPVRELPDLLPSEHFILHVKGTEAGTTELPKRAIRAAISKGEITRSQLIWSPVDNAWRPVRELPDLLPSQKLVPVPSGAAAVPAAKPAAAIIPQSPAGSVAPAAATARVRVAASSANTPTVRAAAPAPVRSTGDLTVKEDDSFHPLKWVCIGLGLLILFALGGNYLLVDQPLVSNLGQTSYSNVTVYAHFGAFMQPNVIEIHIPVSSTITPDNLADFLVALAHSTPQSPITGDLYERVALTSGWMGRYSFSGGNWKELGDMQNEDKAALKEAVLVRLADAGGEPSVPESTLNEAAQQAVRDQVWDKFAAYFTGKR